MGQNVWFCDPYTRSKIESETILWSLAETRRLPLTMIRPSWLYGERDRTTTARLVDAAPKRVTSRWSDGVTIL